MGHATSLLRKSSVNAGSLLDCRIKNGVELLTCNFLAKDAFIVYLRHSRWIDEVSTALNVSTLAEFGVVESPMAALLEDENASKRSSESIRTVVESHHGNHYRFRSDINTCLV